MKFSWLRFKPLDEESLRNGYKSCRQQEHSSFVTMKLGVPSPALYKTAEILRETYERVRDAQLAETLVSQ